MTKKLVWRLKEQPTADSLRELVRDKLLTNEEAREILFNETEETARDMKSLESEIKFLRELVEKLSNGRQSKIIEIIKTVHAPYYQQQWYQPYQTWCGEVTGGNYSLGSSVNAINSATNAMQSLNNLTTGSTSFSAIKTF